MINIPMGYVSHNVCSMVKACAQSFPIGSRAIALALSCRAPAKAVATAKPQPSKECWGISPGLKPLAHPPPFFGGGVFLKIPYLVGHTFSHIRESIKEDGVFHSIALVVFGCLVLFSFSLHRFWAFVALFGGFGRFSVGGRLLPHRFSLCFLLRRVGWIIVLRFSSYNQTSIKYASSSILFAYLQIFS